MQWGKCGKTLEKVTQHFKHMREKSSIRGTRAKTRVYAIGQMWEEKTCKANRLDSANGANYHGCVIK